MAAFGDGEGKTHTHVPLMFLLVTEARRSASTSSGKPTISASEPVAPPTALVWPDAPSRPSSRFEPLRTHVLSDIRRLLADSNDLDKLRGHAAAAAPVREATAVVRLVIVALSVTRSRAIVEATADASCWPTVGLLNDSAIGDLGSSCAWLSFYPHGVWWWYRKLFGLPGLDQWLIMELCNRGVRCRSGCEQESGRE